jgi:hypothetical protein
MSLLQRLAQPVRRCSRGLASDVRTVTLIPGDGIGTYRCSGLPVPICIRIR